MKQETKFTQMRHEIKRLESDNDKLRQTLREKLNLKGNHNHLNQNLSFSFREDTQESNKDEFYEMVRDGFIEQM